MHLALSKLACMVSLLQGSGQEMLVSMNPERSAKTRRLRSPENRPFNPFDQILLLEGAMLFSGAATRRLGSGAAIGLSFPFTVEALTAGCGATAASDDQGFFEFWAPIWRRAAGLEELEALLTEGRAAVDGKTVRDGLEFAVAVRRLGSQRGVAEFQRYALLQREPRNPRKATPLGRVHAHENSRAALISDLDLNGWLSRVHVAVRDKSAPASLLSLGRRLNDALFRVASDDSHDAVQDALNQQGSFPALPGRQQKFDISRVGSLGSWTGLQTVSHQAHERSPANGVATRSKATRLQMDGLPESEVRMSEKHTRFLGRHCAMRVGMRIDAARTSRFERLQS